MKVKVLFFGILSEIVGKPYLIYENVNNITDLQEKIFSEYPNIRNIKLLISVNKSLVKSNITLNENDEIALLPPFAGG